MAERAGDPSEGAGGYSRRAVMRGGGTAALAALGSVALRGRAVAKEPAAKPAPARAGEHTPYVPRPNPTQYTFAVEAKTLDPDGQQGVPGLTVNGSFPGPEIRVRQGEQLRVLVENRLDGRQTAIHWHGILLPAAMDGVPDISNAPIEPGQMYVYEFPLLQSGTYWYHSHVGFQEQIGLYGPLVIEAADDPVHAEHDAVVMLSDWLHRSPEQVYAALRGETPADAPGGAGMPGMGDKKGMSGMAASPGMAGMAGTKEGPAASAMAGMATPAAAAGATAAAAAMPAMKMSGAADLSDVKYPSFLLNGTAPAAPWTLAARPGERIRLRIVNASGSTFFRVALDEHQLEVTHADGIAVRPVTADHLLMGTAETYDVLVTLKKSGSYTLHGVAQDGSGQAIGVLHTPDVRPAPNRALPSFPGRPLAYAQLRAVAPTTLPEGELRTFRLPLQGDMQKYIWMIDGQVWPKADPLRIKRGDRVQIEMTNQTMMWHPMHLHGHFFRLLQGAGDFCPLKHTVNVPPGETVRIEFTADNPGRWFFHCHNVYHLEAGMAREFVYTT